MSYALLLRVGIFALLLCGFSRTGRAQDLAIVRAAVYSAPDAPLRRGLTIVIRHGVIAGIGEHVRIPRGMETISCEGCVVLAGFWNAHVHFIEPKWNEAAKQPAEKLSSQMSDMVNHSGFTTVVDTGSDGENTVALRRRVESGEVRGPRIFTAGIPLFPSHALPYYLDDLPAEFRARMAQPATPSEAVGVVDHNRAAGYDIVKLFTGSIVGPNHIVPMQPDIAKAAVVEAHGHGQQVFAHTTNLEGTMVAINAGVDVLAHTPEVTSGFDESLLRRLVAQGMTIIPTLKLFSHDDDIAAIRSIDYRFHALGGRLVYGTDTGFLSDYDQSEEFRQLMAAGLGFREVLAMLTTAPVELFGLSATEGKVAKGMRGDLTIVSEDPASHPDAFTEIRFTIRGGAVMWRSDEPAKRLAH